jgi:hypothetical protein
MIRVLSEKNIINLKPYYVSPEEQCRNSQNVIYEFCKEAG